MPNPMQQQAAEDRPPPCDADGRVPDAVNAAEAGEKAGDTQRFEPLGARSDGGAKRKQRARVHIDLNGDACAIFLAFEADADARAIAHEDFKEAKPNRSELVVAAITRLQPMAAALASQAHELVTLHAELAALRQKLADAQATIDTTRAQADREVAAAASAALLLQPSAEEQRELRRTAAQQAEPGGAWIHGYFSDT